MQLHLGIQRQTRKVKSDGYTTTVMITNHKHTDTANVMTVPEYPRSYARSIREGRLGAVNRPNRPPATEFLLGEKCKLSLPAFERPRNLPVCKVDEGDNEVLSAINYWSRADPEQFCDAADTYGHTVYTNMWVKFHSASAIVQFLMSLCQAHTSTAPRNRIKVILAE